MAKRKSRRRRRGKTKKTLRTLRVFAFTLAAVLVAGVALVRHYTGIDLLAPVYDAFGLQPGGVPAQVGNGDTAVHFINVGQADATLLQQGDAFALIDAGDSAHTDSLLAYLDAVGADTLQLLVMTHPHADHIGAMAAVLEHCQVERVLLPDFSKAPLPTSRTFEKVLEAIERGQVATDTARVGQSYALGEGTLSVLGAGVETEDYNNLSIVGRFDAPGLSFVFSGDGEEAVEEAALASGQDLRAQVFQAGHHGSNTSNSLGFLQAIRPGLVVISCGADNDYGHPHQEALDHFAQVGARVLRTDQGGNILVRAEPQGLAVYQQNEEAA